MTKLELYNKLNDMVSNGVIHCKVKWCGLDIINVVFPLGSTENIEEIIMDLTENESFSYVSWKYKNRIEINIS